MSAASRAPGECPKCHGKNVERLMSRFRTVRSQESRLEKMADPSSLAGLDEKDPASVARWAKRMGQEMGEDLGEDFDDMVDQAADEDAAPPADDGDNGDE